MSVYRRILRGAEHTHRYWGALEEKKCIGERYHACTLRRRDGARWAQWNKGAFERKAK